jgi:inhibitor of KinA sporulation pathway (predicted exonuclease)
VARKLDQIIVLDIEATCWEGEIPRGQENEIIEVGLCLLDPKTGERSAKASYLVRPERSKVSEFCTRLTTLTQEQVDQGISFREICTILKKEYYAKERAWASYGDYDRSQFTRQCEARGIGYPFGPSHINIKSLYALMNALPQEIGMVDALRELQIPLEGTHHRGVDDAWNTAPILAHLLQRGRQPEAITLFRPIGGKELALLEESGFRAWPPRLPTQPFFYPVLNEDYAAQIARDWNTRDAASDYVGYLTRFRVRADFLTRYTVQTVGGRLHQEYWIPAEELAALNQSLVGPIEVIGEFRSHD